MTQAKCMLIQTSFGVCLIQTVKFYVHKCLWHLQICVCCGEGYVWFRGDFHISSSSTWPYLKLIAYLRNSHVAYVCSFCLFVWRRVEHSNSCFFVYISVEERAMPNLVGIYFNCCSLDRCVTVYIKKHAPCSGIPGEAFLASYSFYIEAYAYIHQRVIIRGRRRERSLTIEGKLLRLYR